MASPQREDGHLDIANELADALARAPLNGTQFRLLWVVMRKTYGWQKTRDRISISQFVEATGLTKTMVARELRRLVERGYLLAEGDNHHAKTFAIQKDYAKWDNGKVCTNRYTVSPQSVQRLDNKCVPIVTPQKPLDKNQATVPNGTAPHGAPEPDQGGTLLDRYERKYREASNRIAVIGELFSVALGSAPNYRRLGAMSKQLNSGGKLLGLIVEASRQHISDDPHDYLARMVQRASRDTGAPRRTQADHNSAQRGKVVV
jgi:phage replication O-like protein O